MLTCWVTWTGKLLFSGGVAVDGVALCTLGGAAILIGWTLGGAVCPRSTIRCTLGGAGIISGTCTLGGAAGIIGWGIGAGRFGVRTLGG